MMFLLNKIRRVATSIDWGKAAGHIGEAWDRFNRTRLGLANAVSLFVVFAGAVVIWNHIWPMVDDLFAGRRITPAEVITRMFWVAITVWGIKLALGAWRKIPAQRKVLMTDPSEHRFRRTADQLRSRVAESTWGLGAPAGTQAWHPAEPVYLDKHTGEPVDHLIVPGSTRDVGPHPAVIWTPEKLASRG